MDVTVGQQLLLNDRPGVVLAVSDFDGCEVVVCLWLGTGALPHALGQPRPGSWMKQTVVLLRFPDGAWYREFDYPMRVRVNDDKARQINVEAWMAAFAQTIHPAPVAF